MPKQLMRFLQILRTSEPVTELSSQILHEYKLLTREQEKATSEDDDTKAILVTL